MTATVFPATKLPVKIVPDDRQQQAIEHVDGPMLVVAGAGTGKTTVLTQRLANLIREGHARPDEIVALTYTDNSAVEMMSRVRGELKGVDIDGLQARTFHAWCNELLHRRGAGFGVLDEKDLWVFLRRRIRDLRLKHFVRAANVGQFLDSLLEFMRRCQDELVGPEQYSEYVIRLERGEHPLPRVAGSKKQDELEDAEILERCREIARVFATVEELLQEKNLGTFGHMITKAYQLLKDDPELLEEERRRSRFLLVDEFQDVNFAQVEILSLLAGPAQNVFAVGDPDQAIYQFRGASSEAFTLFAKKFPAMRIVALEKNRRSLSPILRCAFGIVNDNPPVFSRTLSKTSSKASSQAHSQQENPISYQRTPLESLRDDEAKQRGETNPASLVEIVTWGDKEVEAADLARQIQKTRKVERCRWSDFAVLSRIHSHREDLIREFAERGIPFSIEGLDVLDTPEVRDVVACLTAAVSPNDAASLFRLAALPQFHINPVDLRAAMRAVRRQELNLPAILERLPNGAAVLRSVDKVHGEIKKDEIRADDAVNISIWHFGLERSDQVTAFVKFVEAWHTKAVTETGSPSEFLDYLDYFGQARGAIPLPRSQDDAVQLLTAHAAKGLEYKHVAIIRGSSTWFPCTYKEPLIAFPEELRTSGAPSHDDKTLHEEEERRLFYVAMTRAKDRLAIYAHLGRSKKDPKPTQFLRDLMSNPAYKKFWSTRSAAAVQDTLFAEEEQRIALEQSTVAAWLLMPPIANFVTGLSASAIVIYEECPLRFKLEREWNLPRDVSASLHYGAAMHNVLHTFYAAQRYQREISDDDLLEQFRAYLASAGIADRYQYELYLRQGLEQLRQYLEVARGLPPPEVLETERRFELQVGSAKLSGRIDRMDRTGPDSVAIVDYKTGKPQSQEDADKSLQLSLYALAARDAWGKHADHLIFHNLENNTPVFTTRSDVELEAAQLRVEKAAEGIAEGKFSAKPGFHCAFCPYRNLCPATEKTITSAQKKSRAN